MMSSFLETMKEEVEKISGVVWRGGKVRSNSMDNLVRTWNRRRGSDKIVSDGSTLVRALRARRKARARVG